VKLAIIGSRSFNNYELMKSTITSNFEGIKIALILSGGARGADSLAEVLGKELGIPVKVILPDWKHYGKKAGLIRNTEIIKESDAIAAFWDGSSRGTLDSIRKAEKLGKPVILIPV
jgi:hypothetical protein